HKAPGLYSHLTARVNEWRRYRRTMSELRSLDQRELDDLGIGTGDLEAIARGQNPADIRH
ncbi:MAG: DUF1127 domain-containing protein, partial [Pseudomonadota bacterium]